MNGVDQIKARVAQRFHLELAELESPRRPAHIAFPRQVAMYLVRELTPLSLEQIAAAFSKRDHGTVLHACRLVERRAEADPTLRGTLADLLASLRAQLADRTERRELAHSSVTGDFGGAE